jgi:hypothetical protein
MLPEYVWYHTSTSHSVDDCESNVLAPDSKLIAQNHNEKGKGNGHLGNEQNGLVSTPHHPCVRIQYEKTYLDDIQDKLQTRFPVILPQDCLGLPGYDGLVMELFSRRGQEDLCARVHKEQRETILAQNQELLAMQLRTQEMYFHVLLQCTEWNDLLAKTNKSNDNMNDGSDNEVELAPYTVHFDSTDSEIDDFSWV